MTELHRAPLLLLWCRAGAAPIADAPTLLERARDLPRSEVATDADSIAAVLRAALGFRGAPPRGLPGRGSALEWSHDHWRLVAHNARDPLHGLAGDEGIGRPHP